MYDYNELKKRETKISAKIAKSDGCWVWTSTIDPDGYGRFGLRIGTKVKSYLAHRVVYFLHKGACMDSSVLLCHTCDNRLCVNPAHLFEGNHEANQKDMSDKGRSTWGDKSGLSKWTNEEVKEIRRRHNQGETQASLRREFKMSKSNMSYIINKRTFSKL